MARLNPEFERGGCAGKGMGFGGECGEEDGEDGSDGATVCFWGLRK